MKKLTKKRGKAVALSVAMAAALWLSPERLSAQGSDGYLFDWTESSVGNPYGGDACYYDGMPGGFEWFFDDVVSLFELTWSDIGDLGDWLRGESGTFSGAFTHQSFGSDYEGVFSHQSFGSDYEGGFIHQSFGGEAPLGSGLLVLLSAGMGYSASKRKMNKKNQQKKNQIK